MFSLSFLWRTAVFLLCLVTFPVAASNLFVIVSERNAAQIASAAEQFSIQHPHHQLNFRTPEQLAELSDDEIILLINQADSILLAAVFGDAVPRLLRLLNEYPHSNLIAINGDRRLTLLSRLKGRSLFTQFDEASLKAIHRNPSVDDNLLEHIAQLTLEYPQQSAWLNARSYWQARGSQNMAKLLVWMLALSDHTLPISLPTPQGNIRFFQNNEPIARQYIKLSSQQPFVALLDYDYADRAGEIDLHQQLCLALQQRQLQCISVLARWGESSAQALSEITKLQQHATLAAVISLQDFIVGGGDAHKQADEWFKQLNVPVLKGIRLSDRSETQWRLSEDGLGWESVHYRVAMPELQGISQPIVLATQGAVSHHALTGLRFSINNPLPKQIDLITRRVAKWSQLQTLDNSEKRLAIIYYNHPPGRHNIGADNLDVPATLWHLLNQLKVAGYDVGELPKDQLALLDLLQQRGINLPQDYTALKNMANEVTTLPLDRYRAWFEKLPEVVQQELTHGPLGYLHSSLQRAVDLREYALGIHLLERIYGDIRHLLEGLEHPARNRALDLFEQLQLHYRVILKGELNSPDTWQKAEQLITALRDTGIEGLGGWGAAPGNVMVHDNQFVLPGIQFGKVFIGPQPPRGWEINEALLHANTSFPPTHHYLAFYYWLQYEFKIDAIVHLGRHSTYEFLPRRHVGLTEDDYSAIIASDIPGIYPYIVDGVGEGIQAKRRGLAVMVDHLTPPLAVTELYDHLLELRQLIESYEASNGKADNAHRLRAVASIRRIIDEMDMQQELSKIMSRELAIRGITFEEVDDEMLVHEVGHYLTQIQESFMPFGLHIFGRDWNEPAIEMMLISMGDGEQPAESFRQVLSNSPAAEMNALLAGLAGEYIHPSKGNDPIRTPEVLPTGRNFHALDASLLPTRLGYELGVELATKARKNKQTVEGKEAVVLWASETVRDEGAIVAFGLDMMGIKPIWNSRGTFKGIERLALEPDRVRRDVLFTTSGLFRDLYSQLLVWLDRAVLLALDGASETIRQQYPELIPALDAALLPLGELSQPGNESLQKNQLALHWVTQTQQQLTQGISPQRAGRMATLRLFGDAPGAYGAGINRLAERSGAWSDRSELADNYLFRMGHAYGIGMNGIGAHEAFKDNLKHVENTYLGRASNLYGLIDNNDAFDYLGGLSLAVETVSGKTPNNYVIEHADPDNPTMVALESALLGELRSRFLNPNWLKPLMQHGYAGARTMGSEFMEYLWGWQVTNPEIIESWVWDEVKEVYLDDRLGLGLDEFLQQGHNVHVKINMQAILLVAADKGFWQPDAATLQQLAEDFAQLVTEYGLPGSGHTRPDHPMMKLVEANIDHQLADQFQSILAAAKGPAQPLLEQPLVTTISEINQSSIERSESQEAHEVEHEASNTPWLLLLFIITIMFGGLLNGRRGIK